MTEAVSTPTTAPLIGKIADAVYDLETPLLEIRCLTHLLAALSAAETQIEPEGLDPVHDALHRAHTAADAAFRQALDLLRDARAAAASSGGDGPGSV